MGKQRGRFILGLIVSSCIVVPLIASRTTITDDLSGSHVNICCNQFDGYLDWERNGTGHTISKSGLVIEMMDWLSISMKIEYECIPMKPSDAFTRDNETKTDVWTQLYQLKQNGMCHISPWPFRITYGRFRYSDFLSPFDFNPFVLLIPVPERADGGFSSIWRPFENSVWTALFISIAVTMFLNLVHWLYNHSRIVYGSEQKEFILEIHWLFLFGLLMSKAGFRAPESFKMRLAGGAWCIAALILTNYYSSILTSLITVSVPEPIVNSVEEMANNDNIELTIVKGFGTAVMIQEGLNMPIMKKLDRKLKSSQNSICIDQIDCFRQVVAKKNTTLLHNQASLFGILSNDYRQTRRCNANFAKEMFNSYVAAYSAWAISKHYSQSEAYQRGTLRMVEAGLVGHWKNKFLPKPYQCLIDPNSLQAKMADIRYPDLVNLHDLVPAFVFLLFGFGLALLALLAEWMTKVKLWKFMPLFCSTSSPIVL